MTLPTRTLKEIARQAAKEEHIVASIDDNTTHPRMLQRVADAVALAVLREASKVARFHWGECGRGCEASYILNALDDLLAEFDAPGAQERKEENKDHGAGLIHQAIPDMAGTEPRLNKSEK